MRLTGRRPTASSIATAISPLPRPLTRMFALQLAEAMTGRVGAGRTA